MAPRPSSSRLRASNPKQQSSRNRTASKRVSYREASSDSNEFDDSHSQGHCEPGSSLPARRSRLSRRRPAPAPCANTSTKRKATDPPRRPLGSDKRVKTSHDQEAAKQMKQDNAAIQATGKSMPWDTLPYLILALIFKYASWPLVADGITPLPSTAWLLHTALCCKSFAEPALSALYYSPPLTPPTRAISLVNHLASQDEHSTFNYRAKVKYLDIEASSTLQRKYAGQDPLDLAVLVALTPQLRGICIHRLEDDPKYRNGAHSRTVMPGKPVYHESLILTLRETGLMLQDWTWNQFLAKQSRNLTSIKAIHSTLPFQSLRKLSLVNYVDGPLEKGRRREEILAEALSLLPNLTRLRFRMSSIVNNCLMPLLPDCLQGLEIFDCSALESPGLDKFLVAKGKDLRQMILDHNHSLNLSFLVHLAPSCPKLQFLRMDLRYFNTFFTVRDVEPRYDLLLWPSEVPSWPSSLQCLELFHLRKWGLSTAEQFFSSLTDSSRFLKDMRQLRIKASLDESGWRDRIGFRDKWTQRLQHVFLRKSTPPSPHLESFAAFKAFKKRQIKIQAGGPFAEEEAATAGRSPSMRKGISQLSHVGIPTLVTKAEESDSDAPLASSRLRRSTRSQPQREDIYALSLSSPNSTKPQRRRRRRRRRQRRGSDDSSSEDSAIDDDEVDRTTEGCSTEDKGLPDLVQGMCDVVDVLIDNLRPAEELFGENDFLDEEVSGDEDWNGDEEVGVGDGYAW